MWCIGRLTREYRRRMYALLDLYQQPYRAAYPVVCLDEKSKQLIEDTRVPIDMKSGKAAKTDYGYRRRGTRNLFVAVEPKGGKHILKVTRRRAKEDFAGFVRELADVHYPKARRIHVVLDNLNTHFPSSLYHAFSPGEADRILERIRFHYTPKHAGWLNMAEIEISLLDAECIGCRIADEKTLAEQVRAWAGKANREKRKINWTFTKRDAFRKLSKHYIS